MKRLFLFGALIPITLTGCDTMDFSRYQGEQRAWPTGNAFADGVFAVPVYHGWPEKPYAVLGCIQFANPNIDWNRGDIKMAARQAKEAGGDAVVLIPKASDASPTDAAARQELGIGGTHTTAVVLKWK
ncbi:MAG TPA: hypothetical protein P5534_09375 [Candidatus Paceibacterota bacterium]|nr:hypothetical protein [Candidatus Paceibacterota bacterium]HRZ55198.1 hypothetical protein [Candidatus Paceibacterota bacterium]